MNEEIKKMANLLRTGHTMLNQACPICNNPIFRNVDGITFCPVCNREVIIYDNGIKKKSNKLEQDADQSSIEIKKDNYSSKKQIIEGSIEIILEKINLLNQKMESTVETDLINNYSDILLKLYKILSEIKENY